MLLGFLLSIYLSGFNNDPLNPDKSFHPSLQLQKARTLKGDTPPVTNVMRMSANVNPNISGPAEKIHAIGIKVGFELLVSLTLRKAN